MYERNQQSRYESNQNHVDSRYPSPQQQEAVEGIELGNDRGTERHIYSGYHQNTCYSGDHRHGQQVFK